MAAKEPGQVTCIAPCRTHLTAAERDPTPLLGLLSCPLTSARDPTDADLTGRDADALTANDAHRSVSQLQHAYWRAGAPSAPSVLFVASGNGTAEWGNGEGGAE